jgi:UDP-N-acetylmuramoyl-tripeptide--D-alanyl-D-alanine ligase
MEMGAYREDSIKKLCDFTPPNAGIITAIGLAHLERFKTEEAVYRAKSELAKAIPQNGILVCNGDSPGARRMAEEFKKDTTILYGFDSSMGELDCKASNLSFSELGSTFEITWQGKTYQARTKLLGRPIISNILAAFSMACALGANPELALAAIYNLQPVDNRLKLVKNAGITYLQDAYNSNPTGFASALEVLENLKGAQKILMTPGMVELGERQAIENKMVGEVAAKVCSDVIVVGKTNRDALLAGLEKGGFGDKKAAVVDTREEAFSLLNSIQKEGSVILIENDLPDLYEGKEGF